MISKKLHNILLVDDDDDCNFYHQRLFKKMDVVEKITIATDGQQAIDYLKSTTNGKHPQPAILFLDINMPVMDGWEFLQEYEKLDKNQRAKIVLVMLTTSLNPDDKEKAKQNKYIDAFQTKFLNKEKVIQIIEDNFPENL